MLANFLVLLSDPFGAIESFISRIETTLFAISATFAVIGLLGLGIMYVGSSVPLISEWKKNNPKAFRDVTWGLIILVFASSGAAGTLGIDGTAD